MKNLTEASVKPTTYEQYAKYLDAFNTFAGEHRLDSSLPISTENLGLFLTSLFEKQKSHGTIVGYANAIGFFHKIKCLPDPSDSDFIVKLLNGIKKSKPPSDKRKAIDLKKLELLLTQLSLFELSEYDVILYRAMFLFTYYGCLRVGEVAKSKAKENVIAFDQLTFNFSKQKIDSICLKFLKFKHSDTVKNPRKQKSSLPKMKFTKQSNKRLCPVRAMVKYIKLRGNSEGQLFLTHNGGDVTYHNFNVMMKKCISRVGLEGTYGTHSFRIGRCTDLNKLGYSENQIKLIGRWNSSAFKNYIRPDEIQI